MADQKKELSPEMIRSNESRWQEHFIDGHKNDSVHENKVERENNLESISEGASPEKAISEKKSQIADIDQADVMQDASTLHQLNDRESHIQKLVDLAMHKGVVHAVAVAEKAGDFYMLDQLHDRLLSEELHEQLVARGLIQ